MVSFSNVSLSVEVSNKGPLENGCMPKYKPRNVSAIRDFPPRCGPDAVPVNLRPEGNCGSDSGNVDALGVINVEMTDVLVADGAGTSVVAEVGSSSSLSFRHWVGVNDCADGPGTLDKLLDKAKENVTESKRLVVEIGPLGTLFPEGAEFHRQEGVNNPIEIERDEPVDAYMGKVMTTVINNLSDEVQEMMPELDLVGVETSNEMKFLNQSGSRSMSEVFKEDNCLASSQNSGVDVTESPLKADASIDKDLWPGNSLELPAYCGSDQPETSVRQKDKYHPRRVSAIRDFPPHCGTNASLQIEKENELSSPRKDSLNRTERVESEPSMSTTSGECLDGLHNIHVEIETSEMLNDGAGRGLLQEMTVDTAEGVCLRNDFKEELVHGLMAAPYCTWKKSKAGRNHPDGGTDGLKMRRQNAPLRKKPITDALNSNIEANPSGGCSSLEKTVGLNSHDRYETPGKSTFIDEGDHGASSEYLPEVTPISIFTAEVGNSDIDMNREVVHDMIVAPSCPSKKVKTTGNSNGGISSGKKRKQNLHWRHKSKAVAKKSNPVQYSGSPHNNKKKKTKVHVSNDVDDDTHMLADDGDGDHDRDFAANSCASNKVTDFEITLPPFAPSRSGHGDARNKVRRVLQLFHVICRKLLQKEEADPVQGVEERSPQCSRKIRRHDLFAVQVLKKKEELVNTTKIIGPLPGVEVGDEFQYRVELAIVGIHFPFQSGIDSVKVKDVPLATSIVTSGAYSDDVENADVLIYSGQGGNVIGNSKEPEDQKLERGNLALKNSISHKTPVRVVRGWRETKYVDPMDARPKVVTTYVYDGLYTVTNYWAETGPRGKQVFMFELKRNPGQAELAWKELKKSGRSKTRPGVCVADISGGKERIPIAAVNTLDDDKPPPFNYTAKMMYPDWYSPNPPDGCNCTGRCSKSKKCRCAAKNEGDIPCDIPYNHNGALVETKPLVYECGPHCKCPPSCYNRVTQRGMKFQLEIFKTETRGWGVRALTSIPSGSFICEYSGELLEEKVADERIGNDEYLFDVGQNLIDSSTDPEEQAASAELEKGYTIDALTYGNVGRFINHSCLPNLHAQNVIYDNDDKRMPHIMLFAMDNIPPLTELTYHYNYSLGQVYDSDGNVKVKKCYCGAVGCSGRMY